MFENVDETLENDFSLCGSLMNNIRWLYIYIYIYI